jgi:hypothetical protein
MEDRLISSTDDSRLYSNNHSLADDEFQMAIEQATKK